MQGHTHIEYFWRHLWTNLVISRRRNTHQRTIQGHGGIFNQGLHWYLPRRVRRPKTTLSLDTLSMLPLCGVTATAHQLHLVNALDDSTTTLHFGFLRGFLQHIAWPVSPVGRSDKRGEGIKGRMWGEREKSRATPPIAQWSPKYPQLPISLHFKRLAITPNKTYPNGSICSDLFGLF